MPAYHHFSKLESSGDWRNWKLTRAERGKGTPGIGKTTSILALARALLGENYKEGVLELNASDERLVHPLFSLLLRMSKRS